jgi:hypothetical protein
VKWFLALCPLALLPALLFYYEPRQGPPPSLWFGDLPVRGSLADANRAGFGQCMASGRHMRCRREGVMLLGQGPYSAAVDLLYEDGGGGFEQLTLWHPGDQHAVSDVAEVLKAQGWRLCRTGVDETRGDQEIFTRPGARVRFSIDLSYWGKRRVRILPERGQPTGRCW